MSENFRGMSLAYFRKLTNQTGMYGSAAQAMESSALNEGAPPLGAFVWYEGDPKKGDMGIGLGNDKVLVLSEWGAPTIVYYDEHNSDYLGWSKHIGSKSRYIPDA